MLFESAEFDVEAAVRTAHRILSKNKKGYFLMVEVDTHTDRVRRGIEHMVLMDQVIERTASLVGRDTLLLLTADHSFDLQLRGGRLDTPVLAGLEESEAKAAAEKTGGAESDAQNLGAADGERSHRRTRHRRGEGAGRRASARLHGEHRSLRRDDAGLRLEAERARTPPRRDQSVSPGGAAGPAADIRKRPVIFASQTREPGS